MAMARPAAGRGRPARPTAALEARRHVWLLALLVPLTAAPIIPNDLSDCTINTRQLFPLGGPFAGNTAVTVTGKAFRDLGDVKCRFGIDEVQARLVNETTIECSSPGCTSPTCVSGQEETQVIVPIEVSMNGVTFTGSGLQYTYYDMRHVAVSLLLRHGAVPAQTLQLDDDTRSCSFRPQRTIASFFGAAPAAKAARRE